MFLWIRQALFLGVLNLLPQTFVLFVQTRMLTENIFELIFFCKR